MTPPYYQQHFEFLCQQVVSQYHAILSDFELAFFADYLTLPSNAQCLLIRLIQRQGTFFRLDKLKYDDIPDLAKAIDELSTLSFVHQHTTLPKSQAAKLLTQHELAKALNQASSVKKSTLIALLTAREAETNYAPPAIRCISLSCDDVWQIYQLLFFGNRHQQLNEFVKFELGHVQFAKVIISGNKYRSRLELEWHLTLLRYEHMLHDKLLNHDEIVQLAQMLPFNIDSNWLMRKQHKLINQVAKLLERSAIDVAMQLYQQSQLPPARERLCQLYLRQQQPEQAAAQCQAILAQPMGQSEWHFAQKFHRRFDKSQQLFEPDSFTLTLSPHKEGVEAAVVKWFKQHNSDAIHVENSLVLMLFALVYWPALYAPVTGAWFNQMQFQPADLHEPDFKSKRQPWINTANRAFNSANWQHWLLAAYDQYHGISNAFCAWQIIDRALVAKAIKRIEKPMLAALFARIWTDVSFNRSGLPDLIVFNEQPPYYQFVEVKGPNDSLQHNQRAWFDYFAELTLPATVCYVSYQQP